MRQRRSAAALAGAALSLFLSPPLAPAPRLSGALMATERNDGSDWASFLSYLEATASLPHEELPLKSRVKIGLVDSTGKPAAFTSFRLAEGGRELASGSSYADGSLLIYPGLLPVSGNAPKLRLEARARGAAAVADLELSGPAERKLAIGSPRPVPSPLPVDIVFVVDTTSSMAPFFPALGASLAKALEAIGAASPVLGLKTGLVLFRDRDEAYLTRSTPLSAEGAETLRALGQAEAERGGDEPEALGDGLEAALDLLAGEGEAVKLVFAFTDAPPKLASTPGIASYAEATKRALLGGVRLYTVGLGDLKPAAERALREIAACTGAAFLNAGSSGQTGSSGTGATPMPAAASLRGELSAMLARIVAAEAASVTTGSGNRDPALALLDSVQAKMAAGLSYPEAARRRGTEGAVRLALSVGADGSLRKSRIASSSGSALLDSSALALARSAFPVENPAGAEVELEIEVRYRLTSSIPKS